MQREIIESIGSGKDTLVLLPTGSGKSITFQIPALAKEGICIVVTPLIALMKDQVDKLKGKKIKAVAIHSGLTHQEIDIALDNCIYGNYKFLYCSPERLGTAIFRERFMNMPVSFIAIDEAHCISQWGYDFRPSYMQIAELRQIRPEIPFMALTASATLDVIEDIQDKLKLQNTAIFRASYERKNLIWVVRKTEDKMAYLVKLLNSIPGSGIVYVRNRTKTKEIALHLQKNNMTADYYHAGLSSEARSDKQSEWMTGKTRVIVSTNAFGMGIDKPDVRFVVHFDLADTMEAYYQEAGRAGRDEKKAFAVQLFNKNDEQSVTKRIEINFPDIALIKQTYHNLCNFLQIPIGSGKFMIYDFDLLQFASYYKLGIQFAFSCLKILEQEGYIEYSEDLKSPTRLHFLVNRDDLYKFQVENAAFDNFIKLLLRSYTGLFSDYVSIDETMLAKRAQITEDIVKQYLKGLSKQKIITYIPRRHSPVIIFTEERLDEKTLYISPSAYYARKERYESKINVMLTYAQSDHKCRSQMILNYFGEKDTYRCGFCDNCQLRNELGVSQYDFDLVATELKKLANGTLTTEHILDDLNKRLPEKKVIEIFRWLLDNDKLQKDEQGLVSWKHHKTA